MKESSNINFKIVTTDHDNRTVKDKLWYYVHNMIDYFAKELINRNPQLISSWKDSEVYDNSELLADILIIDDDFDCIIQYFKVIDIFVQREKFTIKNVVACTKADAAHLVIDKIYENVNKKISLDIPAQDPLLVFLDFQLREPGSIEPMKYLMGLLLKIFSRWQRYDIEILGVSAFAFKNDPAFTPFQSQLREELIHSFPKDDLFDKDRMMIHLTNHLLKKRIVNNENNYARKNELDALEKLRNRYGKLKIDSTVVLMDALEYSIADLMSINRDITLESLKVSNKDGGIYTTNSLKVEVGDKKNVIADMLLKSTEIQSFTDRWNRLYHQIEIGCLFSRNIKPLLIQMDPL